jgi:hypothetical protein
VAPAGQLSMPKPELQLSNPDKLEITNYKHQISNKFQITITKSQIRPKANCLEFVICYLKFLIADTPGPDLTLNESGR